MRRFGVCAAAGGLATVLFSLIRWGVPVPSSPAESALVLTALGALGGFSLGGTYLALRNLRRSRSARWTATITLSLLLGWSAWRHATRARGVEAFRASADSTQAVVLGRNPFGSLLVLYERDGSTGRAPLERKTPHAELVAGDSIWVYWRDSGPGQRWDTWPLGPDTLGAIRSAALGSALVLLVMTGYGVSAWRWWVQAHESRGDRQGEV